LDGFRRRDLIQRIFSALVLIPPLAVLIIFGPSYALYLLVTLVALLGLHEFYGLTLPREARWERIAGLVLGALACTVVQWMSYQAFLACMVVIVIVLCFGYVVRPRNINVVPIRIALTYFGIVLIPVLLSHVILLSRLAEGVVWVIMLVTTVWVSDTCAYVAGSLVGKHKLSPAISPNKTIEGLVGCVFGAVLTVLIFKVTVLSVLTLPHGLALGCGMAIFGQLGDLFESVIKRGANTKDSGGLIPGHGGMLDRLDSFLLTAPFLYYFLVYVLFRGGL
jgi:phosphatidate cytidylyltransferase